MSNIDVGMAAKRLDLLKQLLPKLARVAVLRNPANPSGQLQFKGTQAAAQSLRIQLHLVDARDAKELEAGFKTLARARVDALAVLADPLFLSQRMRIAELATANRLPSIFARRENVEAGGLISYGPTLADQFRLGATYVDKILKGAKPSDLPVEEPTRAYLVVNLKTARALKLTIPESIRLRIDQTIE